MADDHASTPRPEFDIETDEGLSAYVEDLHRRHGVPERLRYPETDEEWDALVAEADASDEGYSLDEVHAHFEQRKQELLRKR